MNKGRVIYLDALKGLSIILVVFCHHVVLPSNTVVGNIFMSFAWAAVPCFFMVSGGLMHQAKQFVWKKHIMRMAKIYITLIIWKIIYLFFYMLIETVQIEKQSDILEYLFFFGNISKVDTGPMWFMEAYLQVLVVYPITYYLHLQKEGRRILIYVCILFFINSIGITMMDFFDIGIIKEFFKIVPFSGYTNMLCYFLIGSFLLDNRENLRIMLHKKKYGRLILWSMLGSGMAGLIFIKYRYTGSFRWNDVYLNNGYNRLATLVLTVSVYLIFSIEFKFEHYNALCKLGANTMGIFYLHYPVTVLFKRVCNKLIENYADYYSLGLHITQTVLVVLICYFINIIAKKNRLLRYIFS